MPLITKYRLPRPPADTLPAKFRISPQAGTLLTLWLVKLQVVNNDATEGTIQLDVETDSPTEPLWQSARVVASGEGPTVHWTQGPETPQTAVQNAALTPVMYMPAIPIETGTVTISITTSMTAFEVLSVHIYCLAGRSRRVPLRTQQS